MHLIHASASEVMTIWRYTNVYIIIISILYFFFKPRSAYHNRNLLVFTGCGRTNVGLSVRSGVNADLLL